MVRMMFSDDGVGSVDLYVCGVCWVSKMCCNNKRVLEDRHTETRSGRKVVELS